MLKANEVVGTSSLPYLVDGQAVVLRSLLRSLHIEALDGRASAIAINVKFPTSARLVCDLIHEDKGRLIGLSLLRLLVPSGLPLDVLALVSLDDREGVLVEQRGAGSIHDIRIGTKHVEREPR